MSEPVSTLDRALKLDPRSSLDSDATLAFNLYHQAYDEGDSRAALVLGYLYEKGIYCQSDHRKAVGYYEHLAMQGDVYAKFSLGRLLVDLGETEDGIELLRDAGHEGSSEAHLYLATRYELGTILESNTYAAKHHFIEAAMLGCNVGRQRAAGYLREGDDNDYKLAIEFLEAGCQEDDPYCCWRLAVTINNREGYSRRIRSLAEKSSSLGVREASEWLEAFR